MSPDDYKAKQRRQQEELLCGVQAHEDMLHERDVLLAVLTDFVQEKGLTDLVALLKSVTECVGPLADLLRMTHNSMPTATLHYDGEMYRRIMALDKLLKEQPLGVLAKCRVG